MVHNSVAKESSPETVILLQDIFIVLSLQAGMNVEAIRKHLKVNKWRVSNISKHIKSRANSK